MQAGCDIPKVIYYLLKNIKARLAGCTLTQGVGLVNVNLSHPPNYGMVGIPNVYRGEGDDVIFYCSLV